MHTKSEPTSELSFDDFKATVINDYKIAVTSRECSLLGRREVLTGKAKFGIFGDGKEVPQLAMAKAFRKGDWRSGYYRDQTFMMAIGHFSIENFFAGLYAHTSIENDPMSAGKQMGGHFGTHSLDENGELKNLLEQYNSSADISPTAGQMPRLLGLAQASKIFRNVPETETDGLSDQGNEVAWGTIGNASTSEGMFFETINAAGVLQVPMVISIWDDDYGISVHAKHQTTKENISEILSGFQRNEEETGYEIIRVKGWDYPALMDAFEKAGKIARENHVPVILHVTELTQPQGHSTSGSHERYKSKDRLQWERENDCNVKMREWMINNQIATDEELQEVEKDIKREVREGKRKAWEAFLNPIKKEKKTVLNLINKISAQSENGSFINSIGQNLIDEKDALKNDVIIAARKTLRYVAKETSDDITALKNWVTDYITKEQPNYSSHVFSEFDTKATNIPEVAPEYKDDSETVDARVVLRDNFDAMFTKYPNSVIFGEDAGTIGDVNQGLEGLQEKYGELRVADAGIRETTIIGQGIGLALRGLRPIAEIQYLDYILYAMATLSDDLATLRYRTHGKQTAPVIVRTRGHRLEGIWHSGSQMGSLLGLLRGIYILTPRNMTKAAGFYNTLMQSDEPAVIIECLNGYRLKEKLPENLGDFTTPIGKVEVVREGTDITILSYGSTLRLVQQAAQELQALGISAEVIDAQSLLPFDLNHDTVKSIAKTNRILVVDEDMPGGASAYLMQHLLDKQKAFKHLDSAPQTLTAKPHRPAYGTDGDYFSKPSAEDIFEKVYSIMHEAKPKDFPAIR
ncbi:thiamine pyrophosphate-dependent enzyme [Leeuwenhoekiella polynyae]|uniref:3-methyl-2-oxobutanoate dehydrogenase (2-methylpropanoyl-transferring) n=1 Tax=Leeuwenhoekiella polynyae TaxID=1550906 RepID=A0A4Q0P7W6_9FLAO|nr:alpha-ketoacid dehydrogenase subunit alpha/beta [Leeuwenhoekiella polynyae]RXG21849.1 pyruvate/2-oxoglutarate/acetoin dehydrogenase E1 component [Leeuwenhoekiella polynyae]